MCGICGWIVYNGETYNFPALRSRLETRGHRFRTRSDTEVVLHAYDEWGPEGVHRLRWMFAFCIAEAPRGAARDGFRGPVERLFLARDHGHRLWTLLTFEIWHRLFIDEKLDRAPAAS